MTIEQWLKETHPDHDITLIGVSPRELQKLLNENEIVMKALDALALALTEHNHQWTNEERSLYERAMRQLKKEQLTC